MWQEAAREERPGGGAREDEDGEAEGEGDGEGEGDDAGEYDVREDELDAPRDYDDYTDNAHHEPHRDWHEEVTSPHFHHINLYIFKSYIIFSIFKIRYLNLDHPLFFTPSTIPKIPEILLFVRLLCPYLFDYKKMKRLLKT